MQDRVRNCRKQKLPLLVVDLGACFADFLYKWAGADKSLKGEICRCFENCGQRQRKQRDSEAC